MKFIKEIDLHKINESIVKDEETMDFLYDSEEHYTISKFLAIARKSQECKKQYSGDYNFGKGMKMADKLKKELPHLKFQCRVYRNAWNYGGNLEVSIFLRGKDYKSEVFKYNSADSTKKPRYSFSDVFNGTKKPSDNTVEKDWGMGIIHGSYQSISRYDEFMDDVVGVFNDYQRVNGKPFDMKSVLADFKIKQKISAQWSKLEPKIMKQYNIAKESARKAHRDIQIRAPYIRTGDKTVYYKTDEPREIRHPDEYGDRALAIIDGKDYAKYEAAQSKISDMIESFVAKHGFKFVWAASW